MSILFAFDTATPVLSAAVAEIPSGRILASREERSGGAHSVLLPQIFLDLCAQAGRDPDELSAVAVGLGPGSFTGLRVGVATARGIAQGRRVPLVGCSSLAAMAAAAAPLGALLVPALDARRSQVYAGFYLGREPVQDDAVLDPAALARDLAGRGGPVHLFGEGAAAYAALFDAALGDAWKRLPAAPQTPPASGVAAVCAARVGSYDLEELLRVEPRYLRSSGADRKRAVVLD